MGAFEYTALTESGKQKKGLLEGDSPRHIRQQLRETGLTPMTVDQVESKTGRHQFRHVFEKTIHTSDLALVTRQLATLVRSGMPLESALQAVSQQTDKAHIKSTILAVRAQVLEGETLAHGLAGFPKTFSDLYRSTVEAGEQSGHLDVVLERLADYTEYRQQIKQKATLALLYPVMLTLVALMVVIGLLTYVVPQVIEVFNSIGQALPPLTRGLIALSAFLQHHGGKLLLAVLSGLFMLSIWLRMPKPKMLFHRFLLRLPVIGKLIRGLNAGRFARTFSILMASGVPVLQALEICTRVVTNRPMCQSIKNTAIMVREGAGIAKSLQQNGYFPPILVHLIASGEASGNIEGMLDRAATHQEKESEALINTFLGLFEPLLIIIMGGIVLTIVLAILLPIFNLNQLVK